MSQTYSRVRLVAVLTSSSRGAVRVDADVFTGDLDRLGACRLEDGHDNVGGVPPALLLGDGNPLNAMVAGELVKAQLEGRVKDDPEPPGSRLVHEM